MAIAKIELLQEFDLGKSLEPWEKRHAEGKKLRSKVPRESLGEWRPVCREWGRARQEGGFDGCVYADS